MLKFKNTKKFRKDLKRIKESGKDLNKFKMVSEKLMNQTTLEKKYHDHKLVGSYKGYRECHIEPDWLLIYYIEADCITFTATGSHSYLFKK